LLRHRIFKKPSKLTIVVAGIGVAAAAASAVAVPWPAGAMPRAATTADYLPVSHGVGTANAARFDEQLQSFRTASAWHAQLTVASTEAAAAARRAAARRAAAARAAAAHQAALLAAQRQAARQQTPVRSAPPAPPVQSSGSAQQIAMSLLGSYGWSSGQFSCLDSLWMRESGWDVTAENPDGAYGIPQAYPGSKMASAGPDWQTDATTQIRWGLGYIRSMYGSPCGAWSHELATGWY
jgi:hypothetical protein